MSELTFSQPERRSFLVPGLIALVVLAAGIGIFAMINPYRVPRSPSPRRRRREHTVFASDSKLVGSKPTAQDDLYVVTTCTSTTASRFPSPSTTSPAPSPQPRRRSHRHRHPEERPRQPLCRLSQLVPLAGPPLLRETIIQPGAQLDGMVILHYALAQADWDQRKSASVTIDFYHQDSVTAPIPKT